MGTSGSYSGSGGKPGKDLRNGLEEWLNEIPLPDPPESPPDGDQQEVPPDHEPPTNPIPEQVIQNVLPLLRPRPASGSGSGGGLGGGGGGAGGGGERASGGGRSGGGPRRSVAASARSAGRAAAAAYAYQTGNAAELDRLGLHYDDLRSLGDPLEVTIRIVAAACGPIGEGTIEDDEQRHVAAEVAEWVFAQGAESVPTPEEIVRKTISLIIFETLLSETGELLRRGERPPWASEIAETALREAAEAIVERAPLSVEGVSDTEFAQAIENGVETLRNILWGYQ
jgi:hypothetical protein